MLILSSRHLAHSLPRTRSICIFFPCTLTVDSFVKLLGDHLGLSRDAYPPLEIRLFKVFFQTRRVHAKKKIIRVRPPAENSAVGADRRIIIVADRLHLFLPDNMT